MRKIVSRCIGLNKKEKDIRIGGVKENLPQILKELKANSENKTRQFFISRKRLKRYGMVFKYLHNLFLD